MKKVIGFSLAAITLIALVFTYLFGETFYLGYLNTKEVTELKVDNNTIIMNNLINSKTQGQFEKVFKKNPDIDTIVMKVVDGSIDDDANLKLAKWLNKKDLTFILESDSEIASGGTDLFLAGKDRIIHDGAMVGVHSWSDGLKTAKDYERGDENHKPYIDYYMSLGWDKQEAEKFYYFTIDIAPADGMHRMTNQELVDFNVTNNEIILNQLNKVSNIEKVRENKYSYICSDNYNFSIYYDEYGSENKIVKLPKDEILLEEITVKDDGNYVRAYSLKESISASGEKYEDENGLVLWVKGGEAFIMKQDKIIHNDCIQKEKAYIKAQETIYFDIEDKKWKDEFGICNTCNKENDFLDNGLIEGRETVIWSKVKLKLKNDLNENPPVSEVRELFVNNYSINPEWFGTHVELNDDIYTIIFASSKTLERDYLDDRGYLKAAFEVEEVK